MSKISFPVKLELLQYTKEELDKLKDTFIGKLILDMTQQQQFDLYKAIEYHLYKYPDIGNTNLDEYSINFIQNEIIDRTSCNQHYS